MSPHHPMRRFARLLDDAAERTRANPLQDSLDAAANSRAIMSSAERVPIRRIVGTLHARF